MTPRVPCAWCAGHAWVPGGDGFTPVDCPVCLGKGWLPGPPVPAPLPPAVPAGLVTVRCLLGLHCPGELPPLLRN